MPGSRSVKEVEAGSRPLQAFLMLRNAFYFGVSYWQEPLPPTPLYLTMTISTFPMRRVIRVATSCGW